MSILTWLFGGGEPVPQPEPLLLDADGDPLAVEFQETYHEAVPDNTHWGVLHDGVGHTAPVITRSRGFLGLGRLVTTNRYALTNNGRTRAADVAEALRRSGRGRLVKLDRNALRELERRGKFR